jgi:hypothetical protein
MGRLNLRQSGPWISVAALVCLLWLYVASLFFAPWWAVVGLTLVWLVLLVMALRWFSRHPYATLLLPVFGLALWLGLVWALARPDHP